MNTETKELVDMNSGLLERMDPEEKQQFEEIPESLQEVAKDTLGDKDKTTVKNPSNPLFMWAEMREIQKRLDRLEQKIDHIFGDHVLIDGRWHDISNAKSSRG